MIYFCADDYGLNAVSSERIRQCVEKGCLNKVSVFPNFDKADLKEFAGKVRLSLHINLIEGKCMSDADKISLLADENGNFKHTFGGIFKLNLFNRKKLEAEAYREIKAQVMFWKSILPEGNAFCVDSHQHTHMIPAVFRALLKVLSDEKIDAQYIRIPAEPIFPYIKTPTLYFTYSGVNLIKQWLLNFLWFINKSKAKIPKAYFMGILFSGKMDKKRINKILPQYIKMAEKNGRDIEVLFHPGYLSENESDFKNKNIIFKKFYLSENRKTEFNSVVNI